MSSSPAFGQADLTNCERELIHLAGSIQPHGLLLVVREPGWRIVQASANAGVLLRRPLDSLLLASLAELGGDLETTLRRLAAAGDLREPQPLRCTLPAADGSARFEGAAHRVGADALVVELEPLAAGTNGADSVPPATRCCWNGWRRPCSASARRRRSARWPTAWCAACATSPATTA